MNVWRDRLHRWFAPVAARCPLSPNAVSISALLLNAVAATLLGLGRARPVLFLVAVGVVTVAGLADAFDGIVARVQQKESRYGDFLDHFADRVSDVILLIGWLAGNGVRTSLAIAGVAAIMLNGYAGTQLEATWHQRSYDSVGRGEFVLALVVFPIVSFILATNGWSATVYAGLTVAEWLTLALIAFSIVGIAQRFALAARLEK